MIAMGRRDARGRIMADDPRYGETLCECGNRKGTQALLCRSCYFDSCRGADYWERRTCPECGGPKDLRTVRCRRCTNDHRRGVSIPGREQPPDHPWRRL